jgi:EAL domain-containing protein (putative c-di-GMP-specific phosphodiesterase class I)
MHEADADAAIVEAIITMGHAFGLIVVGEGVERPEQKALLRDLGCDFVQGYLVDRPMPAADLAEYLAERPVRLATMPDAGAVPSWS